MASAFLMKINRQSENFWVRDVREVEPEVYVGVSDNRTSLFSVGDTVAFVAKEVIDRIPYHKPRLALVPAVASQDLENANG